MQFGTTWEKVNITRKLSIRRQQQYCLLRLLARQVSRLISTQKTVADKSRMERMKKLISALEREKKAA